MSDIFSKSKRSEIMSHIGQKNTKPEIIVRRLLHRMGYRFRLYRKDLPGTPDIVLPKYRTVIFVHGCFWHGHDNCPRAKLPETNRGFWEQKINTNRERDERVLKELEDLGWRILIIWQCQIKDLDDLSILLQNFLAGIE